MTNCKEKEIVENCLPKNETIVWCDKPVTGSFFSYVNPVVAVVGFIFLCMGGVFVYFSTVISQYVGEFVVPVFGFFAAIVALAGIYFIVLLPLLSKKNTESTVYAITNKNVIIFVQRTGAMRQYSLDSVVNITLTQKENGIGTVKFFVNSVMGIYVTKGKSYLRSVQIVNVKNAAEVYKMLINQKENIK